LCYGNYSCPRSLDLISDLYFWTVFHLSPPEAARVVLPILRRQVRPVQHTSARHSRPPRSPSVQWTLPAGLPCSDQVLDVAAAKTLNPPTPLRPTSPSTSTFPHGGVSIIPPFLHSLSQSAILRIGFRPKLHARFASVHFTYPHKHIPHAPVPRTFSSFLSFPKSLCSAPSCFSLPSPHDPYRSKTDVNPLHTPHRNPPPGPDVV
jgi:hypothetical protein